MGVTEIAISFLVGILGSAFGAGAAWGFLKGRVVKLEEKQIGMDTRLDALEKGVEKDRVRLADRLARIEVKLDDIRNFVNRGLK